MVNSPNSKLMKRRRIIQGIGSGLMIGLADGNGGGDGGGDGNGGGDGGGDGDGNGQVSLTYWAFGGNTAERNYLKDHADAYEKHPVEYTHQPWGKKFQRIASSTESNSLPNVMAGQQLLIPDYVSLGALQPLDQESYQDRLESVNEKFIQANIDALTYQDLQGNGETHQWGMPGGYSDLGPFIDIRSEHIDQAGFEGPPETWDELLQYGKEIEKLDGVESGFVTSATDFGLTTGYFIGLVYQNGGRYFDPDNLEATINKPGFVDAVSLYEEIAKEGMWPDSILEMNHIDAARQFLEEKAGIFIVFSHAGSIWRTLEAPQSFQDGKGHINTRAPLPNEVTGQFDQKTLLLQNAQGQVMTTANDSQAKRDAAFDYTMWWNTSEQLAPWTYDPDADVGIRGRVPTVKSAFEEPSDLMKSQFGDLIRLYNNDELFTKTIRFPSFAGLDSIQSEINKTVLQPVMLGKKGAQEACDEAQPKVQQIIDQNLK